MIPIEASYVIFFLTRTRRPSGGTTVPGYTWNSANFVLFGVLSVP
jgi:hypothetical protein